MLSAMILAAGYSSRMGTLKPLLSIGNHTALELVIELFQSVGIPDVCVVLGHRADELRPIVEAAGARSVFNSDFDRGMFSSFCVGAQALPPTVDACFVMPADMPLVRVSTVRRMAAHFAGAGNEVVYPSYRNRRGHPTLISRTVLHTALKSSADSKLSEILSGHQEESCDLFVADEGILLDMDTPEELCKLREAARHREIPSEDECEAILAEYQPDERVVRHSHCVAKVAFRVAVALAEKGVAIDPVLTKASALLHDVAKGSDDHARTGARILRRLEFTKIAEIVSVHTDYSFVRGRLDEAAIVYLADKLVRGTKLVWIEGRFKPWLERFHADPAALAEVVRRRSTAEAIACRVESYTGAKLPQLIQAVW